ncbi:MAG TPA: lytic murein transglycosylase, partial [Ramlibacter sp.]|nr:lytic murein transglycosylase [Ramlibacter sp.]
MILSTPSRLLAALTLAVASTVALPAVAQKAAKKTNTAERNSARGVPFATREDAMTWAEDMARRRDLDVDWVRKAVGQAQMLQTVVRLMQPAPPGTAKNWRVYRSRFIDPVRINAGVKFWQENQAALERAEREYGVPAEIIVG